MTAISFLLRDRQSALADQTKSHLAALLLVGVATLAGLLIAPRFGTAPVDLLYIPAVLAAAILGGLWPSLLAAVASTLAFNFFFTAPYRTLLVHRPADVVTIAVLFVVAVVTSQLAGLLREQARIAAAHAARNATIAGFARKLLGCADEDAVARASVEELSRLFAAHAALLAGGSEPWIMASAPAATQLAPSDLAAAAITLSTGEPAGRGVQRLHLADWQFRPVASERAVIATVGMSREDGAPPIADGQLPLFGSLIDQIALALERARVEREAREVATLRERDKLRSVLLASIGEELKPGLKVIAAAARALKREGTADKAVVASVAGEANKLDRYVDNLVDLGAGDEQEPIAICALTIDLHRRIVRKQGDEVHLTPKEYAVLAELARHLGRVLTHAHLLRVVWGPAQEDQIDYLRVAIRALRQKLEADPAKPVLIINEPAVGYRLVA